MLSLNLSRLQTCCRISRGGGFLGSKNLRDSVMTQFIARSSEPNIKKTPFPFVNLILVEI